MQCMPCTIKIWIIIRRNNAAIYYLIILTLILLQRLRSWCYKNETISNATMKNALYKQFFPSQLFNSIQYDELKWTLHFICFYSQPEFFLLVQWTRYKLISNFEIHMIISNKILCPKETREVGRLVEKCKAKLGLPQNGMATNSANASNCFIGCILLEKGVVSMIRSEFSFDFDNFFTSFTR